MIFVQRVTVRNPPSVPPLKKGGSEKVRLVASQEDEPKPPFPKGGLGGFFKASE
jgi:hypothetical protein